MKHFWLIRHAKSSWAEPGATDFERDLNQRGRDNGELMAERYEQLARTTPAARVEWLVTSPARRAAATSEYVARGFALNEQSIIQQPALYNATPETLLAAIRETPDEANCVALIAHNPGMTWLVNALAGHAQSISNLPTLGSALFRTEAEHWSEIASAELVTLLRPKDRPAPG